MEAVAVYQEDWKLFRIIKFCVLEMEKNEIVKGGCRLKMDQMKQDLRMVIEKFYKLSQALVIIHMWKVCY